MWGRWCFIVVYEMFLVIRVISLNSFTSIIVMVGTDVVQEQYKDVKLKAAP